MDKGAISTLECPKAALPRIPDPPPPHSRFLNVCEGNCSYLGGGSGRSELLVLYEMRFLGTVVKRDNYPGPANFSWWGAGSKWLIPRCRLPVARVGNALERHGRDGQHGTSH